MCCISAEYHQISRLCINCCMSGVLTGLLRSLSSRCPVVVQSLSSCCPVVVQSLTGQRLDNERTTTGQRTVLAPVGSGAGAKEKQGWDGRSSPEGATEHRQWCSEAEPLHQITPSFQALKGRRTIMCFPSPPRGFRFLWHSLQGLRSARPLPVIFLFTMAAVSRYFS